MLNQDVVRIAQERIQLEIADQMVRLHEDVARIKAQMSARGNFHSGGTIKLITDVCVLVIKNRGQIVWQTFFRFLTNTGIHYYEALADDLKSLVAQNLPEDMSDTKKVITDNCKLIGMPDLFKHVEPRIDDARKETLFRIGTEIDLFAYSLKGKMEIKEAEASSTIFNIYSPVGAIQTGDNCIANIVQALDVEIKQQLQQTLTQIAAELAQPDIQTPCPKEELIELVREGQEELQKPYPNFTRLRSILPTLGISIQTIASLRPAYETLKQALTFFGISLP